MFKRDFCLSCIYAGRENHFVRLGEVSGFALSAFACMTKVQRMPLSNSVAQTLILPNGDNSEKWNHLHSQMML